MLHQFLKPAFCDGDALLLRVFIRDLESLFLSIRDDVLHVLFSETAENTKKEFSFRKLVRELFLSRQVLAEYWVLQSIIIEILHGYLLISRDLESDDLVLFEMKFLFRKYIPHEAKFGTLHRRQKYIH